MKKLILLILIGCSLQLIAQKYPQQYFRQPIDGKLSLSGNFGELRRDHLHSGLDFKTNGKIGIPIYASADGSVVRIKISVNGFGKAIYIKHPNGFTSVYAHLNHFNKRIEEFVRTVQYKKESFEIELFPALNKFKVKKGEIIAFSGNTGGSEGPHLHYEIRDSKSEKPINPLLFGFKVKDLIRPKIKALKLYPNNYQSLINGENTEAIFRLSGSGESYRLESDSIIRVSGKVSFGISTYDLANEAYNWLGVFKVQLYLDSKLVYDHDVETFAFRESKYVNSLIDYSHYINNRERFQRSEKDPGNKLSIYNIQTGDGVFEFSDSLVHNLKYIVKDVNGNVSALQFYIKASPIDPLITEQIEEPHNWFDFSNNNTFKDKDIILDFKKGSFYQSFDFIYSQSDYKLKAYSKLHHIHFPDYPVHRAFKLALKLSELPNHLQKKVFIARIERGKINVLDSKYENGFIHATANKFGDYIILADTISPIIKALNVHNNKNIKGYKRIVFEISDKISGISKYRASLNGKWILCEFDKKTNRLVYNIDNRTLKGINKLKLVVNDAQNNTRTFEAKFLY